jgi:carbon storage regulator CsrA
MLVLTRKLKQQIQIGPEITITILKVKGQTIRIGIEAPRNVSVLRSELADKPAAEGDPATLSAAGAALRRERQRAVVMDSAPHRSADAVLATAPAQCPLPAASMPLIRLGTRNRRRLMALTIAPSMQS